MVTLILLSKKFIQDPSLAELQLPSFSRTNDLQFLKSIAFTHTSVAAEATTNCVPCTAPLPFSLRSSVQNSGISTIVEEITRRQRSERTPR